MARIDQGEVAETLRRGDGGSASEKGKALEEATVKVFESIPGVSARFRRSKDVFQSQEFDVLFRNQRDGGGLAELGPELLVECKNWGKRVGSEEIGWLGSKLRAAGLPFGVLVAAIGVSGDKATRTAALQQLAAERQEGRYIVVLTREEIENLRSGEQLAELLLDKRLMMLARGEVYLATAEELAGEEDRGARLGWDSLREVIKTIWVECVDEFARDAGENEGDLNRQAETLRAACEEVAAVAETTEADGYAGILALRAALVQMGASAYATVEAIYPGAEPNFVATNAQLSRFGGLRTLPGQRLWTFLVDYLIDELIAEKELGRETAAFGLVAIAVDAVTKIDDYDPAE